jgi:hypothetical protein
MIGTETATTGLLRAPPFHALSLQAAGPAWLDSQASAIVGTAITTRNSRGRRERRLTAHANMTSYGCASRSDSSCQGCMCDRELEPPWRLASGDERVPGTQRETEGRAPPWRAKPHPYRAKCLRTRYSHRHDRAHRPVEMRLHSRAPTVELPIQRVELRVETAVAHREGLDLIEPAIDAAPRLVTAPAGHPAIVRGPRRGLPHVRVVPLLPSSARPHPTVVGDDDARPDRCGVWTGTTAGCMPGARRRSEVKKGAQTPRCLQTVPASVRERS